MQASPPPPKCVDMFSYDKDIRTIFFSGQLLKLCFIIHKYWNTIGAFIIFLYKIIYIVELQRSAVFPLKHKHSSASNVLFLLNVAVYMLKF